MSVAGNNKTYKFAVMRQNWEHGGKWEPTSLGFDLVRVSEFTKETLGIPAGAMAWHGYRIGMEGFADLLTDADAVVQVLDNPDAAFLEEVLKAREVTPDMKRDAKGDIGTAAHKMAEMALTGKRPEADERAFAEEKELGSRYGYGLLDFLDEQVIPHVNSGQIQSIAVERTVWSLKHHGGWCGTFDLGLEWVEHPITGAQGWEILDYKTHKPASGFTKHGPGYIGDAAQCRAYRIAHEEMGLGRTIGNRTVVARDRAYRGKTYLEDFREVTVDFVLELRQLYNQKAEFEKGEMYG